LTVDEKRLGTYRLGLHPARPVPAASSGDALSSDRPSLAEVPLADLSFHSMSPRAKSLIEELEHAPESVQREVLACLRHLRARGAGNDGSEDVHALLPLAESAWAVDWDTPEEDDAWRNL